MKNKIEHVMLISIVLFSFLIFYDTIVLYGQQRYSYRTLLDQAESLTHKDIVFIGVIESIHKRQSSDGSLYYEIDIYRDITVVVDERLFPDKVPHKSDLIEISGTFYQFGEYHHTLYNNLIVASRVRKLESS